MIDEYAYELLANCFMQQRSHNRRIDATGQAEQHSALANAFSDVGDPIGDNVSRRPVAGALANIEDETLDHALPLGSVRYLGVKLNAIKIPRPIFHCGQR